MKYTLIFLLSSLPLHAKDVHNYTCAVDKESKVELSLLDKKTPSVSLFYKNSKFATCQYENTPLSRMGDSRAQINESQWHLKLKKCDYYFEKNKDKIPVLEMAMFKESHERHGNYFLIVAGKQPINCLPKK